MRTVLTAGYMMISMLFGLVQIVATAGVIVFGIIKLIKALKNKELQIKKSSVISFICIAISILSFIFNMGWLRVIMACTLIPVIQPIIFFMINLYAERYSKKAPGLKMINWIFIVTYPLFWICLPDFADAGPSYCFFYQVKDEGVVAAALTSAIIIGIVHIISLILQVVWLVNIRSKKSHNHKALCADGTMKKVIIIGCPGSGKSTFGRLLNKITNIPLHHLDMMYWNEDKTTVGKDVFVERLKTVMATPSWIIDGNYGATMEMRIRECDTVFFLDYEAEICLSGIEERKGKARSDMPWVEEGTDEEFISFVKNYNKESKPKVMELLSKYSTKNIIILKTREEAEKYLEFVSEGYK